MLIKYLQLNDKDKISFKKFLFDILEITCSFRYHSHLRFLINEFLKISLR